MNFFEHQNQARRQTRRLVFLFALAVITIVAVIDLLVVAVLGFSSLESATVEQGLFSSALITNNLTLLAGTSAVTAGVVGLASLFRITALRGGGGKVARDLGGTLVSANTRDLKERRLRNVIEEMALASGIPVPEIYVLEQEAGINAFAAGFTPSDAAIAVTRGTLDTLSRDELQGVIAHEFSHIFNGDMRLNIRLMGMLFGILMLSIIGRRVMHSASYTRSSKDSGAGAILMIAVAVTVVGYIGLFFGRMIKSAVSRQREYLADASAVQFTRHPDGIAGALKKIAVHSQHSHLEAETEEVSHMLFGAGGRERMFASHPPLNDRIRRIQPDFLEEELDVIRDRMNRKDRQESQKRERQQQEAGRNKMFDAGELIDNIGNPDWQQLAYAAALAASIPEDVRNAAHSPEWVPEVILLLLLDEDPDLREEQLLIVSQRMGEQSEIQLRALLGSMEQIKPEQRLPLLEISFQALRRRPASYLEELMTTVRLLVHVDDRVDVFEYVLAKIIQVHLDDAAAPAAAARPGARKLSSCEAELRLLLDIIAVHGHADADAARRARMAGLEHLGLDEQEQPDVPLPWHEGLDQALAKLDELQPSDKERLVTAIVLTIGNDEHLDVSEIELMRAICAALHAPVPVITMSG